MPGHVCQPLSCSGYPRLLEFKAHFFDNDLLRVQMCKLSHDLEADTSIAEGRGLPTQYS